MGGRKATTGSTFGLNSIQVDAAQMLAYGCSEEQIMHDLLGIRETSTAAARSKARRTLHKWMDLPGFADCYRSEVKRCWTPLYGRAVKVVGDQLDSDQPWLRNKAANDVLSRAGAVIMGEEDKKVVVQIEGAPKLGTPDQDE